MKGTFGSCGEVGPQAKRTQSVHLYRERKRERRTTSPVQPTARNDRVWTRTHAHVHTSHGTPADSRNRSATAMSIESTSRFLSYILRHHPEEIGLKLDRGGWVEVDELVRKAEAHGRSLSRERIDRVLRETDKNRFTVRGGRIRANYGHSIEVDLEVAPAAPPETLYHGTARHALTDIRAEGLRPQSRQYVHLSTGPDDAEAVGRRHGTPVVLRVQAADLHADGHPFYRTAGDVWLTPHVPTCALVVPDDAGD